MIHFLDSSALVKRYVVESGSVAVRALFKRNAAIAVSRLAPVETAAAFSRALREKRLTARAMSDAYARLCDDVASAVVIELRPVIAQRAAELAIASGLRAYDAVQLASALAIRERGTAVTFWCADNGLSAAAVQHGLRLPAALENP